MNYQATESDSRRTSGVNPAPTHSSAAVRQDEMPDASELVVEYKPLVLKIARGIYNRLPAESTIQFDDLTQAGFIGLLDAASKYNGSHGASFATYAHIRINGAIIDEIRRGDWTPRSVYKQIRSVDQARNEIEMQNGRQAADREIASRMSISTSRFQRVRSDLHGTRLYRAQQLEGPPDDAEHNDPFMDTVAGPAINPMDLVSHEAACEALDRSVAALPKRDAELLMLYFKTDLTLKQAGALHAITESRASQIVKHSIDQLGDRMSEHAWSLPGP